MCIWQWPLFWLSGVWRKPDKQHHLLPHLVLNEKELRQRRWRTKWGSADDRNQVGGCNPVWEPCGPADAFRIMWTDLSYRQCPDWTSQPTVWEGQCCSREIKIGEQMRILLCMVIWLSERQNGEIEHGKNFIFPKFTNQISHFSTRREGVRVKWCQDGLEKMCCHGNQRMGQRCLS